MPAPTADDAGRNIPPKCKIRNTIKSTMLSPYYVIKVTMSNEGLTSIFCFNIQSVYGITSVTITMILLFMAKFIKIAKNFNIIH